MQRDRLANLRAQQANSNANANTNQYSNGGGGYPAEQPASYELTNVNGSGGMQGFYNEISSIQDSLRQFNDNVSRIGDLHSRSLNNLDDASAHNNANQLDELVNDTSALSASLKSRIKELQKQAQGTTGRDGQIRKQQTELVKSKFIEAIQGYQTVEQQYRQRHKQRMERQFKIVKPDASPEEVRAVVDDTRGQIFQQALLDTRLGDSRAAYREVQERHEDIKRIERTLGELAQLFNDMSILVEQQDETVNHIEQQAATVAHDTEAALQQTDKAVASARSARRKRWICFIIFLVVAVILAVVLAIIFRPGGSGNPRPQAQAPQPTASSA